MLDVMLIFLLVANARNPAIFWYGFVQEVNRLYSLLKFLPSEADDVNCINIYKLSSA